MVEEPTPTSNPTFKHQGAAGRTREELGSIKKAAGTDPCCCHALVEKHFTFSLIIIVSALFRGCNPAEVFTRVLVGRWSLDVVSRACGLGSGLSTAQPGILAIPSQCCPERDPCVFPSPTHGLRVGSNIMQRVLTPANVTARTGYGTGWRCVLTAGEVGGQEKSPRRRLVGVDHLLQPANGLSALSPPHPADADLNDSSRALASLNARVLGGPALLRITACSPSRLFSGWSGGRAGRG